jgi:NAD(P)H-hydrate epimerase
MAIPVLNAKQMRDIDRISIEDIGIPGSVLMELAGRACAEEAERFLPADRFGQVAVFCGKGNNGGDGFVAARYLKNSGHHVRVYLLADPASLKGDARLNYEILGKLGQKVDTLSHRSEIENLSLGHVDVILDALFGTGLSSDVHGLFVPLIEKMNASGHAIVAVDLPSGLCSDTGSIKGCAVKALRTVTFGAPKCGHLLFPGPDLTGKLCVADIGFPPELFGTQTWLLNDEDLVCYLKNRPTDSHKGDFGHLLVVAGSLEKPGAAGLCCRAACRTGAGLVTLAAPFDVLSRVVSGSVEFMGLHASSIKQFMHASQDKQAVVLGPGLGQKPDTKALVTSLVRELVNPLVIDADALNSLVGHLDLLKKAPGVRILTPHPGEMARLLEITSREVQADRLGLSRELASSYGCVVVLKGAHTVVADPEKNAFIVPTGNPGMASGGSGDVLTGMIGALLCQGLKELEAACVGAYLHGAAGDLAAIKMSQMGQTANDIVDSIPTVLLRLQEMQGSKWKPARN